MEKSFYIIQVGCVKSAPAYLLDILASKRNIDMSRILLVLTILVLTACASPKPKQFEERQPLQSPNAVSTIPPTASENCSVYVYRNKTTFHALNPEQPFLYVGEEKIGRLAIGKSHCLHLPPGTHTISVKEPILFMPSYTSGRVEVKITGTAPIYVRYGREFAGIATAGSNTIAMANSSLQLVSENQWRARQ